MGGKQNSWRPGWIEASWVGALAVVGAGMALAFQPVPTTLNDFFTPGTQPNTLTAGLVSATQCSFCHSDYDEAAAPYNRWANSMMGQASRDPIFRAALAIANNDAANSGETCLRCHAPVGWLNGHSTPSDGSALQFDDLQGASCSVCHRMVDPVHTPGIDPADDVAILAAISPPALASPHNGSFVIDPSDRRRGPRDLDSDWYRPPEYEGWPGWHEYRKSPFHSDSRMCATCHDVSLPHFSEQPNGSYELNALNTPGPDKYSQYPEQRTYSEWSKSLFAQGPVDLGGRFGGARGPAVSSCQDCHMPGVADQGGCALDPPLRPSLAQHNFNGANSWVLRAIRSLYFDSETGMSEQGVEDAIARNLDMLARASDLAVTRVGSTIRARITNFTGHKLPTGYPEGRRMWINVVFKDSSGNLLAEHGAYDPLLAELDAGSTKVYERTSGISAATAALTGRPAGESFHLVLNSTIIKDNRIPPMGFNNAEFESVQAGHQPPNLYADGQYWDDTYFTIPANSATVTVNVYHQTTTREYIEFLRDEVNSITPPNGAGQLAYDLWVAFGKSEPVLMDTQVLPLQCRCDWNQSGMVTVQDIFDYLSSYFIGAGDFNESGATTIQDIFDFLVCYFSGC